MAPPDTTDTGTGTDPPANTAPPSSNTGASATNATGASTSTIDLTTMPNSEINARVRNHTTEMLQLWKDLKAAAEASDRENYKTNAQNVKDHLTFDIAVFLELLQRPNVREETKEKVLLAVSTCNRYISEITNKQAAFDDSLEKSASIMRASIPVFEARITRIERHMELRNQ